MDLNAVKTARATQKAYKEGVMGIWIILVLAALLYPSLGSAADFEYNGLKLGARLKSLPKTEYACSPLLSDLICKKKQPGTVFGVHATKVELGFKKERLYLIFVGFAPEDTPEIQKGLEKTYGAPAQATTTPSGIYKAKWTRGDTELSILRQDSRREANFQMIDYTGVP